MPPISEFVVFWFLEIFQMAPPTPPLTSFLEKYIVLLRKLLSLAKTCNILGLLIPKRPFKIFAMTLPPWNISKERTNSEI